MTEIRRLGINEEGVVEVQTDRGVFGTELNFLPRKDKNPLKELLERDTICAMRKIAKKYGISMRDLEDRLRNGEVFT